jgi:capsular polysaccharide biosynthesis protein
VSPAFVSTAEYVQRFPGRWHVVFDPAPLRWSPPRSFGSRTIEFDLPASASELGVLELENGRVFGTHGWVIGANDLLLADLSWYQGPNDRIRIPRRLPKARRLTGSCLSLVSDWSCRNYAHFVLDGLGRLGLFLEAGFTLAQVDHINCPRPPSAAAARLLDRLAVPSEKRVWATPETLVEADVLFAPSLPASSLTYGAWLPRFLRRATRSSRTHPQDRCLYVTRRGFSRQVATEEALWPLLIERGFEIYDPERHIDQADDFFAAAVVVGAHGAPATSNTAISQELAAERARRVSSARTPSTLLSRRTNSPPRSTS